MGDKVTVIERRFTVDLKHFAQLVMVALVLLVSTASAQTEQTVSKHLGVQSCAGSTCHGSNIEFQDSGILRNEYLTWNQNDPHARAYKTLLTEESKRIAAKMGIGAAEKAPECLSCHADNVAAAQRGPQFNIVEGVGCEVCHGAAEQYLESHTSASHQQNLQAGLYKTEDPFVRAEICVSCHVGDSDQRKITHEIMGAGHPRMSFELNTFSSIQPAHYRVDADYIKRKGDVSELQIWSVGQLVAAERFVQNVRDYPRSGLFPELAHMDCLGCHQAMSKITWTQNPITKLPAGAMRYNEAYLLMAYQIVQMVEPDQAPSLLKSIRSFLKTDSNSKSFKATVSSLLAELNQAQQVLASKPIKAQQGKKLLNELIDFALQSSHRDYMTAEQSAMAINSVMRVLDRDQALGENKLQAIAGVNALFASLQDAEKYQPAKFVNGIKKVKRSLN